MQALRLYGKQDIRVDTIDPPSEPKTGEVRIQVKAVGICGSDLHYYQDGGIGDMVIEKPMVIGHEFMGQIVAIGDNALDGEGQPLRVGQRVAVEPTCPCYHCEWCEQGHPNLCPNHTFYGAYPTDGAMQSEMIVLARNCFPIPDSISDGGGALLETLGVAIHAHDLAHLKIANSVAIIGCGPVGLLILKVAKLAGANPIYATDCYDWRVKKAVEWGATEAWVADENSVQNVRDATNGRGVDVIFEAAWADHSIQQAAEMVRIGGRIVQVGIPSKDDALHIQHSTARRKGLTITVVRRMKHTYPRAINLATSGAMDLDDLVSHQFSLSDAPDAFAMNAAYKEGVHKIIIKPS
ncbi:MAG: alcohol dehydrogenase catalytic domain-containing protein [Anaerolineae bacterium]|nr:alcohol dehydrogenase catalytic domain-containing protein [Anaerolineae bacterium]